MTQTPVASGQQKEDAPTPWLCTCREPMTAGVLHRWDQPCYRVADVEEVAC